MLDTVGLGAMGCCTLAGDDCGLEAVELSPEMSVFVYTCIFHVVGVKEKHVACQFVEAVIGPWLHSANLAFASILDCTLTALTSRIQRRYMHHFQ